MKKLVGLGRLELPTSPLSGVRSSHLSYRPNERHFIISESMNLASRHGSRRYIREFSLLPGRNVYNAGHCYLGYLGMRCGPAVRRNGISGQGRTVIRSRH